jgi:hypothetical protein
MIISSFHFYHEKQTYFPHQNLKFTRSKLTFFAFCSLCEMGMIKPHLTAPKRLALVLALIGVLPLPDAHYCKRCISRNFSYRKCLQASRIQGAAYGVGAGASTAIAVSALFGPIGIVGAGLAIAEGALLGAFKTSD